MPTATKPRTDKIPTRDDIDPKYTWNLADLFADDQAWEAAFKKAQAITDKVRNLMGKLSESAQTLWECLELRSELSQLVSQMAQYAHLNQDLDSRVSRYQEMTERTSMLGSQAAAALAFVEPELLAMDEKRLREFASQFPRTDVYDFYITELLRSRKHIRSEEVEEVLAMSSIVARGSTQIFNMLDDADITYPKITDENGNEIQLTKQRYAKLMESSVQRVRKDAHEGFYSPYKSHVNTLGASLASSVNKDVFYSRSRRYESSLHHALDGDNIDPAVYHALLDTTEANIGPMYKYMAMRKRLLKVDKLWPYDALCPLFPDQNYEVPYDDAVQRVLDATTPLGSEYTKVVREGFDSRWVDVFETAGKTGGAFSWSTYGKHPFVLMNYNDTVDNMFTLAHEFGHALHSHLANNAQPFSKAHYSTFVAEVASTLNEGLLLDYLINKVKDTQERLYYLNRLLDNTMGTFFHQVMYARFELMIHNEVEQGGALSPDRMNEIWGDLTRTYYGPSVEVDEFTPMKWSRIPHFYNAFYVFQYATSYAASEAILKKVLDGEAGIIDRYLDMLAAGGSDYPIELLKRCDVDMSTPAPVLATIKRFEETVDEVDRLTS